jgi:hypothetical protein
MTCYMSWNPHQPLVLRGVSALVFLVPSVSQIIYRQMLFGPNVTNVNICGRRLLYVTSLIYPLQCRAFGGGGV